MEALSTALRPKRFGDVRGQEHAVSYLSGLILRGRIGRHILLHGTVGSGKTTLARIYGQALLCEAALEGDGSACGACPACIKVIGKEDDSGFYEYDVPGAGGGIAAVEKWLAERRFKSSHLKRRVIFLDEAHGLTDDATTAILKRVEEAPPDITFIFATSEHHNLPNALRSRLVPLKVRPLQPGQSASLLREAAKAKQLSIDNDALLLLTVAVSGQPRDLLNALDQLTIYGEPIKVATLRRVFDLEYLDALDRYLSALGAQDEAEMNRIILGWCDSGEEKLRWVLAVLAGIYTVDILGVVGEVDPIVAHLAPQRRAALQSLRSRVNVASDAKLGPYWRRLLGHWRPELVAADDAVIAAEFVAFHALVCGRHPSVDETAFDFTTTERQRFEREESFLNQSHVKTALDRASFLTQEYGVYFNAQFVVEPVADSGKWSEQAGLSERFCEALKTELRRLGTDAFAALWAIEGTNNGIIGRVAAHIPETIGVDALNGLDSVRQWCRGWIDEMVEANVILKTRKQKEKPASFHWKAVRDLLNALHEAVLVEDSDLNPTSLRKLIKLPVSGHRDASIAPEPLVQSSGLISPEVVQAAIEAGFAPISVFTDRAWDHLFDDWEREEYEDRRRAKSKMQRQLEDLAGQFPESEERQKQEALLRQSGTIDPHSRSRTWSTWWAP